MKTALTFILTTFCCASAFGLHGASTNSAVKNFAALRTNPKPAMVQAVDIHGQRSSATVRFFLIQRVALKVDKKGL
jgi:hypothetical protein